MISAKAAIADGQGNFSIEEIQVDKPGEHEVLVQIKASGINPISQLDPSAHIPAEWVAQALAYLCGPGADAYLGDDFSLKHNEGRAAVGLPLIDA